MIRFKMFPVIFFVMIFSSCHLIAKDKRAENNPGETAATRGLAAAGEPLYQICVKDFKSKHDTYKKTEYVEIFHYIPPHENPDHYRSFKILSGTECVWVRESMFQNLGMRRVKIEHYSRDQYTITSHSVCNAFRRYVYRSGVNTLEVDRCRPTNYIFKPDVGRFTQEVFLNRIPLPDFSKSYIYPPVSQ